ncbi:hypothetical protein BC831DRAFT_463182 [Entophlyctis helioformis]|nr:hypothetical protein BC831DRAFT_463182 [Entophlyctis helioformis]
MKNLFKRANSQSAHQPGDGSSAAAPASAPAASAPAAPATPTRQTTKKTASKATVHRIQMLNLASKQARDGSTVHAMQLPPPLYPDLSEQEQEQAASVKSFLEDNPHIMLTVAEYTKLSNTPVAEAMRFLADLKAACEGSIIKPVPSATAKLKGMLNIGNSAACRIWLDTSRWSGCLPHSLLFAMFSTGSTYDALLDTPTQDGDDEMDYSMRRYMRFSLETSIRLVINRLRQGELVDEMYMTRFRRSLSELGFYGPDPPSGANGQPAINTAVTAQHDSGELFLFLLEALGAPFLPLQSQMFHGGQSSSDDSRLFTERVIQLSVPENPIHIGVLFEDLLLDHFFNNQVQIERDMPGSSSGTGASGSSSGPQAAESSSSSGSGANANGGSSTVNGVPKKTIQAWQANRLLPFFTPESESGDHARDVTAERHANLTIPFILKRYSFDYRTGVSSRIGRRVFIPTEIPFGLFVIQNPQQAAIAMEVSGIVNPQDYTLKLRSVLCHLGNDPRRGHYVSIVSKRPPVNINAPPGPPNPSPATPSVVAADGCVDADGADTASGDTASEASSEIGSLTSGLANSTLSFAPSTTAATVDATAMLSTPASTPASTPPSMSPARPSPLSPTRSNTRRAQAPNSPPPKSPRSLSFRRTKSVTSTPVSALFGTGSSSSSTLSQWLYFDDNRKGERVRTVSTPQSVSDTFNFISLNGYMVFYELCPRSTDEPLQQSVYPYILESVRPGSLDPSKKQKACTIL